MPVGAGSLGAPPFRSRSGASVTSRSPISDDRLPPPPHPPPLDEEDRVDADELERDEPQAKRITHSAANAVGREVRDMPPPSRREERKRCCVPASPPATAVPRAIARVFPRVRRAASAARDAGA
jgi:hypothetical protein